jgi:hypothetical protein
LGEKKNSTCCCDDGQKPNPAKGKLYCSPARQAFKQSYLPGEFTRKNKLGKERDIQLGELLKLAGSRYESIIDVAEIEPMVSIANAILHGNKLTAFYADTHILKFFKIIKAMIENAPTPR